MQPTKIACATVCKGAKRRTVDLAAHRAMAEIDEFDNAVELPFYFAAQAATRDHRD